MLRIDPQIPPLEPHVLFYLAPILSSLLVPCLDGLNDTSGLLPCRWPLKRRVRSHNEWQELVDPKTLLVPLPQKAVSQFRTFLPLWHM